MGKGEPQNAGKIGLPNIKEWNLFYTKYINQFKMIEECLNLSSWNHKTPKKKFKKKE